MSTREREHSPERRQAVFYGWWVVVAAMGIMFVMAGTGFYSFGVLLKPLMAHFGWSRGAVSIAQSIYLLTNSAVGLVTGKLAERHSIRKIIFIGGLVGGGAWIMLSLTSSLWYLYFFYFVLGIGLGGAAGLVPASVAISHWFVRRRGAAMGVATAGIALGAMVLTPAVGFVTNAFGWRMSYLFMGAVVFAIDLPLAALLMRNRPQDKGLLPDGDLPAPQVERAAAPAHPHVGQGGSKRWISSASMWLLCVGFALAQIGEMSILIHEVAFITDIGISATAAAAAFGLTGGMGGIGKVIFGWLTDKISARYVTMLCFGLQLGGVFVLMATDSLAMVWVFVAVFGFSMGGMVTLMPLATSDLFGGSSFGVVYGFVHFVVIGVSTAGPPLAGFLYDATQSYATVFMIFAATYAASLAAVYFAWGVNPRPLRSPRGGRAPGLH